jgi:hypothetical protein
LEVRARSRPSGSKHTHICPGGCGVVTESGVQAWRPNGLDGHLLSMKAFAAMAFATAW